MIPQAFTSSPEHILPQERSTLNIKEARGALNAYLDRFICGDALAVMRQIPDAGIDLVVTSPPYNLKNSTGNGLKDGRRKMAACSAYKWVCKSSRQYALWGIRRLATRLSDRNAQASSWTRRHFL